VARYIRRKDASDTVDPGIAVADAHQGRGLGLRLLQSLAVVAHANQVAVFEAHVLADNRPMLHLLGKIGARIGSPSQGVVEVSVDLSAVGRTQVSSLDGKAA
jgi:L-amino acid N-acyltransferase YncA